jgi:hypothetical protein
MKTWQMGMTCDLKQKDSTVRSCSNGILFDKDELAKLERDQPTLRQDEYNRRKSLIQKELYNFEHVLDVLKRHEAASPRPLLKQSLHFLDGAMPRLSAASNPQWVGVEATEAMNVSSVNK